MIPQQPRLRIVEDRLDEAIVPSTGADDPGRGRSLVEPTSHIFVVGVSRSGTSLMRRILERSPEVGICRENHFLGHLIRSEGVRYRLRRLGDPRDDQVIDRIVDYIYSGKLASSSRLRDPSSHWNWLVANVDKNDFAGRLLASDRSERAIFDAVLDTYAENRGKRIRGEKTPAHVRYVDDLMHWYPNGRVIHMVRDPRAIYVSELRRRQEVHAAHPYRELARWRPALAAFIVAETAVAWAESVRRARRNERRYGYRYIVLRFEDLVSSPERVIRGLAERAGIAFVPAMLEQRVVSKGCALGTRGFDRQAADRWRASIEPWARRSLEALLLRSPRYGYLP